MSTVKTYWSLGAAPSYLIACPVNTGKGCPVYTPGTPVTGVIESPVQVEFGAITSAAEGAMVKLLRLGTVRALSVELEDDMRG
jgi:hypothetical protein